MVDITNPWRARLFFLELGKVLSGLLVDNVLLDDRCAAGGVIFNEFSGFLDETLNDDFEFGVRCHLGFTPIVAGVTSERSWNLAYSWLLFVLYCRMIRHNERMWYTSVVYNL